MVCTSAGGTGDVRTEAGAGPTGRSARRWWPPDGSPGVREESSRSSFRTVRTVLVRVVPVLGPVLPGARVPAPSERLRGPARRRCCPPRGRARHQLRPRRSPRRSRRIRGSARPRVRGFRHDRPQGARGPPRRWTGARHGRAGMYRPCVRQRRFPVRDSPSPPRPAAWAECTTPAGHRKGGCAGPPGPWTAASELRLGKPLSRSRALRTLLLPGLVRFSARAGSATCATGWRARAAGRPPTPASRPAAARSRGCGGTSSHRSG